MYYLTFNRLQEITEVAETLIFFSPRLTHRHLCCENHPGTSLRGSIFTFSDCLNFKIKHFLHLSKKSKYEFLWCTLSRSIFVCHGYRCFTVFVLCKHSHICDFCSWVRFLYFSLMDTAVFCGFFLYLKTVLFLFLSYMDIVVRGFWSTQTPYVVCCLSHTYNVAIVRGGGCSVDVLLLVVSEELRPC